VVDLHDADIERSALKLQGWLGMARALAARARVLLILPDAVRALVGRVLPPGVRGLGRAAFDRHARAWPVQFRVDATHSGGRHDCDVRDTRWSGAGAAAGPLADLPLLHPNVTWEPAARRLRDAWAATPPALAAGALAGLVILCGGGGGHRGQLTPGRAFTLVDDENDAAVQTVLMRLLRDGGAAELVVAGTTPDAIRRMALEVCVVAGVAFHGLVDAAAIAPSRGDGNANKEMARRTSDGLAALLAAGEASCPRA
jgi:hypothetical protein